jgi:tellurite methyltransferase
VRRESRESHAKENAGAAAMMNPLLNASPLISNFATVIPFPGKVIDVGCGPGRNAIFLAEQGFTVEAVDRDASAIAALGALAERRNVSPRITAVCTDIEDHPIEGAPVAVVCTFVLHFLGQHALETLDRMQSATAPGGLNIIAAFTERGQWPQERKRGCFLKPGELRERYARWDILFYEEKLVGTRECSAEGIPLRQEAAAIVARKRN